MLQRDSATWSRWGELASGTYLTTNPTRYPGFGQELSYNPGGPSIDTDFLLSCCLPFVEYPGLFARPAALLLIAAYLYGVVSMANLQMRPRSAVLIGGTGFALLLQHIELALSSRRCFEHHGSTSEAPCVSPERDLDLREWSPRQVRRLKHLQIRIPQHRNSRPARAPPSQNNCVLAGAACGTR